MHKLTLCDRLMTSIQSQFHKGSWRHDVGEVCSIPIFTTGSGLNLRLPLVTKAGSIDVSRCYSIHIDPSVDYTDTLILDCFTAVTIKRSTSIV